MTVAGFGRHVDITQDLGDFPELGRGRVVVRVPSWGAKFLIYELYLNVEQKQSFYYDTSANACKHHTYVYTQYNKYKAVHLFVFSGYFRETTSEP